MWFLFFAWGGLVGALVGLTAIGTGLVGTPGLILLFGLPGVEAVATMSFCGVFMMAAGAAGHVAGRNVDAPVAAAFGLTAIPVSFVSAVYADAIGEVVDLRVIIGIVIVAAVAAMGVRMWRKGRGEEGEESWKWRVAAAPFVGVLSGFLVGATSISGSVIVLSMVFALRLPEKKAVGTTVLVSAAALVAGVAGHGLEGRLRWDAVLGLLPGVVLGVLVGSRLVKRLPVRAVRAAMMVILAAAGTWILVDGIARG